MARYRRRRRRSKKRSSRRGVDGGRVEKYWMPCAQDWTAEDNVNWRADYAIEYKHANVSAADSPIIAKCMPNCMYRYNNPVYCLRNGAWAAAPAIKTGVACGRYYQTAAGASDDVTANYKYQLGSKAALTAAELYADLGTVEYIVPNQMKNWQDRSAEFYYYKIHKVVYTWSWNPYASEGGCDSSGRKYYIVYGGTHGDRDWTYYTNYQDNFSVAQLRREGMKVKVLRPGKTVRVTVIPRLVRNTDLADAVDNTTIGAKPRWLHTEDEAEMKHYTMFWCATTDKTACVKWDGNPDRVPNANPEPYDCIKFQRTARVSFASRSTASTAITFPC